VLLLVLENSRYLTVALIKRSSAGRFGPCFDAGSQQIEHEHDDEHEHDSLTSESGLKQGPTAFLSREGCWGGGRVIYSPDAA
jgi:hypothetical protein